MCGQERYQGHILGLKKTARNGSNVIYRYCNFHSTFILELSSLVKVDSYFFLFFSVRLMSVSAWSFNFLSLLQRPMTSDFEGFSFPDFIHYIYFPFLILEKEPAVFPVFDVDVKQGNYLYYFITSLV